MSSLDSFSHLCLGKKLPITFNYLWVSICVLLPIFCLGMHSFPNVLGTSLRLFSSKSSSSSSSSFIRNLLRQAAISFYTSRDFQMLCRPRRPTSTTLSLPLSLSLSHSSPLFLTLSFIQSVWMFVSLSFSLLGLSSVQFNLCWATQRVSSSKNYNLNCFPKALDVALQSCLEFLSFFSFS